HALRKPHAERLELPLHPPDGGAHEEPATWQDVHAGEQHRDGDRRPIGEDYHARAEGHALGRGREPWQHRERIEHVFAVDHVDIPRNDHVVRHPDGVETRLLRTAYDRQHAVDLDGPSVMRNADTELHPVLPKVRKLTAPLRGHDSAVTAPTAQSAFPVRYTAESA